MDVGTYYKYQAKARGITTLQHVQNAASVNAPIYDAIVSPWLPSDRHARLYEVACGPGIFLTWLKSHGYENITGSDSSSVQVELAKAGGYNVVLADSIQELRNLHQNSLDCIIGLDFYEHLPKEVFLDFLQEASRTLAPGGRVILRGPNGDSPIVGRALYNDITHVTTYTTISLKALLEMFELYNPEFFDDTLPSIRTYRWLRVPIAWAAQQLYRGLIRLATRENIRCLSASIFFTAQKSYANK